MCNGKRDKIGIIIWLCIMLAATVSIEISERWRWFLFDDLQQEDVLSIDIVLRAYPPYQISESDQITVVDCLKQLEVSVAVSGSFPPFIVLDGCAFWHGVLHLKDGSCVSLTVSAYGTVSLDERDYNCKNTEAKKQISDIFHSYLDIIRETSKPTYNH